MEKFVFGLGVMVIGLLVVFVGLIILIGFIKVLTAVADRKSGKPAASKKAEKPAGAAAPVAPPPPVAAPAQGVPAEVLAAITAAIAAVWQAPTGFVVRHVKRVNNAPAWNRAGREEQTYSRF